MNGPKRVARFSIAMSLRPEGMKVRRGIGDKLVAGRSYEIGLLSIFAAISKTAVSGERWGSAGMMGPGAARGRHMGEERSVNLRSRLCRASLVERPIIEEKLRMSHDNSIVGARFGKRGPVATGCAPWQRLGAKER
jgi:hypothetical protein